jgi:hypothetical protein
MTFAEIEEMVGRVRFTGLFSSFRLTVEQRPAVATSFAEAQRQANVPGVRFRLSGRVPERDSGELEPAVHVHDVDSDALQRFRGNVNDMLLDIFHHMLRTLARHEADESLTYAGIRPFDPHRKDGE